jgi:transcription elongation factor GreB
LGYRQEIVSQTLINQTMSRYRPPLPSGSPHITPQGAARLRDELQRLWKIDRPQVTAAVNEAAKNGDRSENGDYIYGKRRLREIDRRVRYLSKRLEVLTIVNQLPSDQNRVYFGAWITVADDNGGQVTYRIVGSDEINPALGYISIDSPMAKALLGKTCNESFELWLSNKKHLRFIEAVSYKNPNQNDD